MVKPFTKGDLVYQFKITLRDVNPKIWRRVVVTSDTTVEQFNDILQLSMGWYNCHLWEFNINGQRIGNDLEEEMCSMPNIDDMKKLLAQSTNPMQEKYLKGLIEQATGSSDEEESYGLQTQLYDFHLKEKDKFYFTYDFGDNWEHEIILEKCLDKSAKKQYPSCTSGKRACPPEDCGGPWGYEEMLVAVNDPENHEYDEWLEEDFDSELFTVGLINQILRDEYLSCN